MQTSFLHPPFGFALFFLRSVAPDKPYVDKVTGKVMEPVTTMQIYKGAIPFLFIQLVMVSVLIAFPQLVTGSLDKKVQVDMDAIGAQMRESLGSGAGYGGAEAAGGSDWSSGSAWGDGGSESGAAKPEGADAGWGNDSAWGDESSATEPATPGSEAAPAAPAAPATEGYGADDPMKAMQDALKTQ